MFPCPLVGTHWIPDKPREMFALQTVTRHPRASFSLRVHTESMWLAFNMCSPVHVYWVVIWGFQNRGHLAPSLQPTVRLTTLYPSFRKQHGHLKLFCSAERSCLSKTNFPVLKFVAQTTTVSTAEVAMWSMHITVIRRGTRWEDKDWTSMQDEVQGLGKTSNCLSVLSFSVRNPGISKGWWRRKAFHHTVMTDAEMYTAVCHMWSWSWFMPCTRLVHAAPSFDTSLGATKHAWWLWQADTTKIKT